MIKEFSIPRRRVPILLGKGGSTKRKIEEMGEVELQVRGNAVIISGDAEKVFLAERVVEAIGRGFDAETALNLLDPDYVLYVLELPKKLNHRVRVRARLIGTGGSIRRRIEEETGAKISIYGKTVSVLGPLDEAEAARRAVEMILRGAKFSNVFRYLKSVKERWLWWA